MKSTAALAVVGDGLMTFPGFASDREVRIAAIERIAGSSVLDGIGGGLATEGGVVRAFGMQG